MLFRRRQPEPQPRYVVRQPDLDSQRYLLHNKWVDGKGYCWVVFDTQTGQQVYEVNGHDYELTSKEQALGRAKALNADSKGHVYPYIFDCFTGARVWDDPDPANVADRCAALNQADTETRQMAPIGRWQQIATAQVRAQLRRHPAPWKVRDTGFALEVRAADDELIAVCDTYPDAASIQSLAELAMTDPLGFAPKIKAELDRPI